MVLRYAEPDDSDEHDQNTKEMGASQADIVTPGDLPSRLGRRKRGRKDDAIRALRSCVSRARCKSPEPAGAERGDPVLPGGCSAKCGAPQMVTHPNHTGDQVCGGQHHRDKAVRAKGADREYRQIRH